MSTLLLEPSPLLQASLGEVEKHDEHEERTLFSQQTSAHGGLTLDEMITSVWEGLAVRDVVPCPVCDGAMELAAPERRDGSPTSVCRDCGSRLS